MEALALTSGSPWAGATTMAVFVIGTAPLFAVLGYAARKAATAWRGRLAATTGLAMGLYTLNGGLELAGSPLSARRLAEAVGLGPAPVTAAQAPADAPPVAAADGRQTVIVTARTGSYSPTNLQVQSGLPTTLIVRSANAQGCVRAFIIRDKQWILPVRGDTRIELGTLQPGRLDYTCGMGMYSGTLEDLPGVIRAETRLRDGRSTVQVDPSQCDPEQLVAAVVQAGYTAEVIEP